MTQMTEEATLVPFEPGRLDGSPVLVLAPHPDDEVLGCGGAVALAVRAGAVVRAVVLTDGAVQGEEERRRQESIEGARRLGCDEPVFWGYGDRSLDPASLDLRERLRRCLIEVSPRIILAPSPAEVHPDHRATALALYRVLQASADDPELDAAVQGVRVATWEVSGLLRPNLLLDVSDVWDDVLAAAKAHVSQLEARPYDDVMDALARARRLTLPLGVRRAEAYHVVDLRWIRTRAASEWAAAQGPSSRLETVDDVAGIDVVVRTQNRPELLREALESLVTQEVAPSSVIVVNDGGVPVDAVCEPFAERLSLGMVEHAEPRGRARAAQAGLDRCSASHVVFLDDDDRLFPEHLATLGGAVARGITVPYSDAVQSVWERGGDGRLELKARHRTFHTDFDHDVLRLVNAIPLLTVALPCQLTREVGGFDSAVDQYEDWDLLLRLAERTPFVHLPWITCEYRIIRSSRSISAANPPGSPGQVAAHRAVWERHGVLEAPERAVRAVLALVAERDQQAERARRLDEELTELRGSFDGVAGELGQMRTELEAERRGHEATGTELDRVRAEEGRLHATAGELVAEVERLHDEERARHEELAALRHEVERLQLLVETMQGTRAWRLHRWLERLRGRRP
jgi:LmbE family N-acetylglucosaminyl deacetylase/glycosyltransferase involved in cell wall biosynthesis